jgi:hypothetical protein
MTLDVSIRLLVIAALYKDYLNKTCIFFEAVLSYTNFGL